MENDKAIPASEPCELEEVTVGVAFKDVFAAECKEVTTRRGFANFKAASGAPTSEGLTGLGLSGGGIRSGTFCLGLLQGLHELGLLRAFDYLSTVSGGGYVGGWWSAFLNRKAFVVVRRDDGERLALLLPKKLQCDASATPDSCALSAKPGVTLTEADEALLIGAAGADACLTELLKRLCSATRLFPPAEEIEPDRAPTRTAGAPVKTGGAPPDPLHHLRLFANYLTPRKGALSADSWRAITVISRNLIFTWLALVPILLAAIALGRTYFVAEALLPSRQVRVDGQYPLRSLPKPTTTPASRQSTPATVPAPATASSATASATPWSTLSVAFSFTPSTTFSGGPSAGRLTPPPTPPVVAPAPNATSAAPVPPRNAVDVEAVLARLRFASYPLLFILGLVAFMSLYWLWTILALPGNFGTRMMAWVAIVAFLGIVVLVICVAAAQPSLVPRSTRIYFAALAISVVALGLKTHHPMRFMDRVLNTNDGVERLRNKIVRYHGKLLIFGAVVSLVLLVAGFGHDVTSWVWHKASAVGGSTILLAIASAVYTGIMNAPSGGGDERQARNFGLPSKVVFAMAPLLAMVVLLLGAAYLTHAVFEFACAAPMTQCGRLPWPYFAAAFGTCALYAMMAIKFGFQGSHGVTLVCALIALAGWAVGFWALFGKGPPDVYGLLAMHCCVVLALVALVGAMGLLADPNALSLHGFYKARLTRAYLGASNPRRPADRDVTEAAEGDDVPLYAVRNAARGGPFPLINTTLNLVGSHDLSAAQRLAGSFVLSPLHCGSRRTGYRATAEYASGRMTLGTAVAVSGAAVAPNSGAQTQSAAIGMLLTFLNVRLGFWAPNPIGRLWRMPKPQLWPFYTLRELLSQTTDLHNYVYLTDGGHFDNTSLYSLVERGCRNILIADCGADPALCFQDLGDVIRRCRIDFNAEIRIDLTPLKRPRRSKTSRAHFAVGEILYDNRHVSGLWETSGSAPEDLTGRLVLVKPSLTRSVPADVQQYAAENDAFPQQTTADQWFGESQFESYRRLGRHTALEVFGRRAAMAPFTNGTPLTEKDVNALFDELAAH